MGKIEIKPDCGNSPRKIFLASLHTAFAKGDKSFLKDNISDNVTWEVIGAKKIIRKLGFLREVTKRPYWKAKQIIVDTIITHGYEASVSGQATTTNNLKYSFCDIYKFKGAGGIEIKEISTFMIGLECKSP